jgi:branched-chain amino acid transport system substrate-binding protein
MKKMRGGDHQAMQEMYAVKIESGQFNVIGRVSADQAIGPDTCTRF